MQVKNGLTGPSQRYATSFQLTDLTRDVGPGSLVTGGAEELLGGAVFDQLAHVEKNDVVGNAPGLPEDMGHHHNRITVFQDLELLLDQLGGDGIKG